MCREALPCSTAAQPLSALDQTRSLTGKVCPWGKVMKEKSWSLLRMLLAAPHFILPLNSATPEQMSTRPLTKLLGSNYVLVLKSAKGKLKLQDSYVQRLISALWESLLTYLFNLHPSVLYLFLRLWVMTNLPLLDFTLQMRSAVTSWLQLPWGE